MNAIWRCAFLAGPVLAVAAIGPAAAQPSGAEEVIVVTARREAAPARILPQSIAVLAGDDLRTLESAEDVVSRLPGVQAAISNGSQTTFQIRGVGAVDHQALTPSAAAVHVDGVFLATNVQASLLAYDLERVEVLKGPQGALQGRNASSGSINFITAAPTDSLEGYLDISYGRFERMDARFALSGPLSRRARGRIAARALSQEAAIDNIAGPADAGGVRDEYGLRGALEVDLGAESTLLLRAHIEADNGVNPAPRNSGLVLGKHEIAVGADGVRGTDNDFHGASLQYSARWGRWRVTSLTAIEGFAQRYGFDFDGTPAAIANLSYDRDYTQISQDVFARANWSHGSALVGLSLAQDDFAQDYLIWCGVLDAETLVGSCQYPAAPARVGPSPASTSPAVSLLTHIEQERRMGALYGVFDFALGPATTLTLGGRQTLERIEGEGFGQHIYADGVRALNNRGGNGLAQGRNVIEENRFTGTAALRHQLSPNAMIYASFGQGYKSGGFNGEVANDATHYLDEGLFRAETVDAYEIGFKGALGAALQLEAALFYQDYTRPQARVFVNFPLPGGGAITSNSLSNLDAAIVQGAEASASWRPSEGFEMFGAVVLLDSEIEQGGGGANTAAFDGNPLPFASELSATLGVRQHWRLGGAMRAGYEIFAKHQSAYYLDPEGRADRRQGAVTLVDARIALTVREGAEIALWGRNLTDEDYALSGYGFIGYDTFRSQPATWGLSLRLTH